MHTNVLPLPFVALLVYGAIQVLKSIVPGMDLWPNNVTRAAGYALTYAAIVVNARVGAPLHWADLWGLLPTAAAVYGGSALIYHVQDNGGIVRTGAPGPDDVPPPAVVAPPEPAPVGPSVLPPPEPSVPAKSAPYAPPEGSLTYTGPGAP